MILLEAIQQANTAAEIETLAFANIQEFQSFLDKYDYSNYPINIVLPYTSNGTTNGIGIRKSIVNLQGYVVTRIAQDTNDWRSLDLETEYIHPMRVLAMGFIQALLDTSIIDHDRSSSVSDVITPQYQFLNAHTFGVGYTINLPIIENACYSAEYVLPASLAPYKVYSALITQSGTSNPTVTVLRNTLGVNITWTRTGDGEYQGVSTNAFTELKTWYVILGKQGFEFMELYRSNASTMVIKSFDGNLNKTPIEIRVYS